MEKKLWLRKKKTEFHKLFEKSCSHFQNLGVSVFRNIQTGLSTDPKNRKSPHSWRCRAPMRVVFKATGYDFLREQGDEFGSLAAACRPATQAGP